MEVSKLSETTISKLRIIYDNTIDKFVRGELNFYDRKLFSDISFEKFLNWYIYSYNCRENIL